jgi:hypothetical protein
MRRLALFGACAALLVAAPGGALALTTAKIRWRNGSVTRIGALDLARTPTIKRVSDAFGRPTRKRLENKVLCVVDWRGLGVRANFVNLGAPRRGQTTCATTVGRLQTAEIRGARWRTQNGLAVGDSVARLRRLHPGARRHGTTWWLATKASMLGGDGSGRIPIVRANVKDGKVTVFVLWIGAAGE